MSHDSRRFSERLLDCEPLSEDLYQAYQEEVQIMLEKKLGPAGRAVWWFWTVFSLAQAAFFAGVAIWSYGELPLWSTIGFASGSAFGLAFAALSGWIAVRGRLNLRTHPPAMAGLAWGVVVIMMTLLMVGAPVSVSGVRALVSGLAFLVMGAVFMLASRTEQAELRTKEKLLEIEYRLAELAERLPGHTKS